MYREKVDLFLDTIANTPDADFVDLIEDLMNAAGEYLKRVVFLEAASIVGKLNKDGTEYGENIQKLDGDRSTAHNNLIATVKAINNLSRMHGIPVLYEGNEESRVVIADFAQRIVDEYFSTRKL